MQADPPAYRFKVSLRLVHPAVELSGCSAEFGLEPFRHCTVGEPRTTPRGDPLDGVWGDSYWTAPLEIGADEDLEKALARIGYWLGEHHAFMTNHVSSGGSAELFIGFFLESFNGGFLLEPALLAKFSALGVALGIDIYGSDDEPVAL